VIRGETLELKAREPVAIHDDSPSATMIAVIEVPAGQAGVYLRPDSAIDGIEGDQLGFPIRSGGNPLTNVELGTSGQAYLVAEHDTSVAILITGA
jgi:hypothetical protein